MGLLLKLMFGSDWSLALQLERPAEYEFKLYIGGALRQLIIGPTIPRPRLDHPSGASLIEM